MLLNPSNEEALYNLAKLKLSTSDYDKSRKQIKNLVLFVTNFAVKTITKN